MVYAFKFSSKNAPANLFFFVRYRRVDDADFFLDLTDVVAEAFDFLVELAQHRFTGFGFGCEESDVVLVGADVGAAAFEGADKTVAFAVELGVVAFELFDGCLEAVHAGACLVEVEPAAEL